ncbi:peptidoglycan recognition family protein [Paenibacillus sp. CMAA1739]|uniref:peptidoglycan recognition protein family protein n=1 Tax=Paenibacillus ottowii TaxID=2315729 RepID=UPI002DB6F21C|nr:peptidoglycan recognition family protein [Paenibacillus sp. CMAA1739]MEC4565307.1 peptidoglycan recognition family protein [Paenibacillus sp. CMAA1739]
MIQQGNFLLMEKDEFRDWLSKQSVSRKIDRLQVHHTASPNYKTRRMVNGIAQQDHFECLEGMRRYHLSEGWSGTGQNITIFEDGKVGISLDRNLNKTPAGIRNANSGAICIEIIGYFDKGNDVMTDKQKNAVVHIYACLAEKFNLTIDTNHIVYHAWFTYGGTRLTDFKPGESSKTCPGTAFWGDGNTVAAAKKNFLPQIQAELDQLKSKNKTTVSEDDQPMTIQEQADFQALQEQVKQLTSKLSMDKIPDWAMEACVAAKNAGAVDTTSGGSFDFYRLITVLYRKGFFK